MSTIEQPPASTPTIQEEYSLLQELEAVGHLKLGLQGAQGSGKSFTAMLVAIGLKKHWKLDGPIAMFDTEKGSAFLRDRVLKDTGQPLLGYRGRSMAKAMTWMEQCVEAGISVAIIDSITHISDECRDSFVAQRNQAHRRNDRRLQIDEIMGLQDAWRPFVDYILNAPLHLVCCGRLGFEWGHEDVDGSGTLQLIRTDRKMKAMGGFGYELDLVCDMERTTKKVAAGRSKKKTVLTSESIHRLTVVKDRFDKLDGKQVDNPGFPFFRAFVDNLTPGSIATVDTSLQTDHGVDESGRNRWRAEQRDRKIYTEKIEEELERCFPGRTAQAKASKQAIAEEIFGTRSWTQISETLPFPELKDGWTRLYKLLREKYPPAALELTAPEAKKEAAP